jgi:hypothetical protein
VLPLFYVSFLEKDLKGIGSEKEGLLPVMLPVRRNHWGFHASWSRESLERFWHKWALWTISPPQPLQQQQLQHHRRLGGMIHFASWDYGTLGNNMRRTVPFNLLPKDIPCHDTPTTYRYTTFPTA